MDLQLIIERLTDVEWVKNIVRPQTVQSIQTTYYSPTGQPFPTNEEIDDEWVVILQEREAEEAEEAAEVARVETLATDSGSSTFKTYTSEQVDNYLNDKYDPTDYFAAISAFDAATTTTDLKVAIGNVFDEIAKLLNASSAVDEKLAKQVVGLITIVDSKL